MITGMQCTNFGTCAIGWPPLHYTIVLC